MAHSLEGRGGLEPTVAQFPRKASMGLEMGVIGYMASIVAIGRWPHVRNFMFPNCASHAATATTPTLLLIKEHLGIEGGSISRCCNTYENRPCDYSEHYRSHGNNSSYEGHCVNATKVGPRNWKRGPPQETGGAAHNLP